MAVAAGYVEGWHERVVDGRPVIFYDFSLRSVQQQQWKMARRYSEMHTFHTEVRAV